MWKNYIDQKYIKELSYLGCKFLELDEANNIGHGKLFDTLSTSQEKLWTMKTALPLAPNKERINIPFPYDAIEHEDHKIGKNSISSIVENYINENFSEEKFLFSTIEENFIAISFSKFSYDILECIYSGNLTTPFVIFDENVNDCFIVDFELCINIMSLNNFASNEFAEIEFSDILEYFRENFIECVTHGNQHHLNMINVNFVPRIEGLSNFTF